jgi:asparaginyl-tRNA synthetase
MEKSVEDLMRDLSLAQEKVVQLQQEVERKKQQQNSKADQLSLKQRTQIKDIIGRPDQGEALIGQTVLIAGWCRSLRLAEKDTLGFIQIADGTIHTPLQIVANQGCGGWDGVLSKVATGCSLQIIGELVASPAKGQKVELKAKDVVVLGECPADVYPLAKKHHTLEYLRTIGHLRPRTNTIGAVARVRNALAMATHQYFQSLKYLYVHTPIITASDCEGAGEMFSVTSLLSDKGKPVNPPLAKDGKVDYSKDFFKRPAFLTVSGQLNGEIYACALSSIYTFGPTFRAEESVTTRHLAEFWMIEPEIAFADLEEDMAVAEGYIKYVLRYVLENCAEDMAFFEDAEKRLMKDSKEKDYKSEPLRDRLKLVVNEPFARITYTEAVDILHKSGVAFKEPLPKWGDDLKSEHERYIAEKVYKKPVIVINYPKELKAFYMRVNEDGKTVAAMDILVPGVGEIIGGSQREERLDVLEKRILAQGMELESYKWYLDLRRYGSVPHAGFGLGFERLVCYTTGIENIRDAIPFPRYLHHADF